MARIAHRKNWKLMGKRRQLPEFRDRFLTNSLRGFQRRRKAISHHGNLEFHWDADDAFEWLTVTFTAPRLPSVILQLVERNRINLYIRSNDKSDRGKVLLRMESAALVDDASGIVDAFESTLSSLHSLTRTPEKTRLEIERLWHRLRVRPVA